MVATEAQRLIDQRIPGMQSAYEKQIAQLRKDLKTAREDPSGSYDSRQSELEAELARARREADSLRAGRLYPDAFPVFEGIMNASTVEEQLELLQAALRPQAYRPEPGTAAPQAAPQEPMATPPVDPNRPLSAAPPTVGGNQMTKDLADRLLDTIGNVWPRFD